MRICESSYVLSQSKGLVEPLVPDFTTLCISILLATNAPAYVDAQEPSTLSLFIYVGDGCISPNRDDAWISNGAELAAAIATPSVASMFPGIRSSGMSIVAQRGQNAVTAATCAAIADAIGGGGFQFAAAGGVCSIAPPVFYGMSAIEVLENSNTGAGPRLERDSPFCSSGDPKVYVRMISPTASPSSIPSMSPSAIPTTRTPTGAPTAEPSSALPTRDPTAFPTEFDACHQFICSAMCAGDCGWDTNTDLCRSGHNTSQEERMARIGCESMTSTSSTTFASNITAPTSTEASTGTYSPVNTVVFLNNTETPALDYVLIGLIAVFVVTAIVTAYWLRLARASRVIEHQNSPIELEDVSDSVEPSMAESLGGFGELHEYGMLAESPVPSRTSGYLEVTAAPYGKALFAGSPNRGIPTVSPSKLYAQAGGISFG